MARLAELLKQNNRVSGQFESSRKTSAGTAGTAAGAAPRTAKAFAATKLHDLLHIAESPEPTKSRRDRGGDPGLTRGKTRSRLERRFGRA
jgi:hypothetical protein